MLSTVTNSNYAPSRIVSPRLHLIGVRKLLGWVCIGLMLSCAVLLGKEGKQIWEIITLEGIENAGPKPLVPSPPAFAYTKSSSDSAKLSYAAGAISEIFGGPAEVPVEVSEVPGEIPLESTGPEFAGAPPDLTGNGIVGGVPLILDTTDLSFLNGGIAVAHLADHDNTVSLLSSSPCH
jgi:hypothetical protein